MKLALERERKKEKKESFVEGCGVWKDVGEYKKEWKKDEGEREKERTHKALHSDYSIKWNNYNAWDSSNRLVYAFCCISFNHAPIHYTVYIEEMYIYMHQPRMKHIYVTYNAAKQLKLEEAFHGGVCYRAKYLVTLFTSFHEVSSSIEYDTAAPYLEPLLFDACPN